MRTSSSQHYTMLSIAKDKLLALGTLDINEPESSFKERSHGCYVRVTLDDGTPALIYLSRCYRDEWVASIALWPTVDAEEYMHLSGADSRAGEAFACGWLNRWEFEGRAIGIERFHDAYAYVDKQRKSCLAAMLASHGVAA